ncbi:MAG: cyanophycinase [Bdellovibrionia bacterium]
MLTKTKKTFLKLVVAFSLFLSLFASFPESALATNQHLLLVGGGNLPREAVTRFVSWAGGRQARILIITWATEVPDETYQDMVKDLSAEHPGGFLWSKSPPLTAAAKAEFVSMLQQATAVFFSGGDQKRIFDVIDDDHILYALQSRYLAGIPFAGTSAGTAVMSSVAIAGGEFDVIDGRRVPIHRGLGLVQGVIVDQHFIRRSRENRLFGLVLLYPQYLGLGIDQDTSIAIENGRYGEVVGPGDVMLVKAQRVPGSLTVSLLLPGQRVDLHLR